MRRLIGPLLAVLAAIYLGAAPVLLSWSPCTQYEGIAALSGFLAAPLFFAFGLFVVAALTFAAAASLSFGGLLAMIACLAVMAALVLSAAIAIRSYRRSGRWPPLSSAAALITVAAVSAVANGMFCASLSV